MKKVKILMDMPIMVEISDTSAADKVFDEVFSYFEYVDNKFSTYKKNSEISRINRNLIPQKEYSRDMAEVLKLCEFYKTKTEGYFDIRTSKGLIDPSGLVKGWAISKASRLLANMGFNNFYINAGGDIEVKGLNDSQKPWTIGIRHPMVQNKIVKKISLTKGAIATSGTYERGAHIYNPHTHQTVTDIVSLTVIGPNILEADVYATAAFAMGKEGIRFIGNLKGFEGYMIEKTDLATYTGGFEKYVLNT